MNEYTWRARIVKVGHEDDNNLIGLTGTVIGVLGDSELRLFEVDEHQKLNNDQRLAHAMSGGLILFVDELELIA